MTAWFAHPLIALRRAWQRLWVAARREAPAATDPQALARLLAMLASGGSAEIAGVVIPPVLIWVYSREQPPAPLLAWAGTYWAVCGAALVARWCFRRDLQRLPPARLTALWLPRFRALALLFGAIWGALAWVTVGAGSHEFATLVYLVLSAVVASTAVSAAPVFSVFLLFFVACWGAGTAAVFGMFPQQWPWVLPLQLLYGLIILRHAGTTHHFVVEQLRLQARSDQLARSYQLARDDAERALRAKSELLMRASHDLRQPVHALAMIADVLARRSTEPQLAPALDDLKTCLHTLQLMFESLMELSQLEAGKIEPLPVRCPLRPLLEEVDAQFRAEAMGRQLRWRVRLPPADAAVRADPVLLRRAIFNLVQNALRYTRQGGVLLAVRGRAGLWRIEVRDTGVGVAEADRGQIYAPFYRHADGQRLDGSGRGLGLAVFAECVDVMGASSGLVSTPGKGSCFWFALPASSEAAPADAPQPLWQPAQPLPPPPAAERHAPGPARPEAPPQATPASQADPQGLAHAEATLPASATRQCLVVEADPKRAAHWRWLLAGWPVELRLASDGALAARWLAGGFQPDAIFCSLGTPGEVDGFALLRALMAASPQAAGALIGDEAQAAELMLAEEQGYWVLRRPLADETLHTLLTLWLATPADGSAPSWPVAPHAAA